MASGGFSNPEVRLVDTDVFSYIWRGDSRGDLYKPDLMGFIPAVCFVTIAELYKGAFAARWNAAKIEQLEFSLSRYLVLPYDDSVAVMWARVQTAIRGRAFPPNDAWVAACALAYGCPVLSHNRRDFHDVPGIHLVNHRP